MFEDQYEDTSRLDYSPATGIFVALTIAFGLIFAGVLVGRALACWPL